MIVTRERAKTATKIIVGSSVNFVVATAIANVVPTETKTQQVKLFIGSYAISGMVSAKAGDWAGDRFEEAATFVTTVKQKFKENAESE